jgi:hypothetical protein
LKIVRSWNEFAMIVQELASQALGIGGIQQGEGIGQDMAESPAGIIGIKATGGAELF